jgi:hypothetical protein
MSVRSTIKHFRNIVLVELCYRVPLVGERYAAGWALNRGWIDPVAAPDWQQRGYHRLVAEMRAASEHVVTRINDYYYVCDKCGDTGSERWAILHQYPETTKPPR